MKKFIATFLILFLSLFSYGQSNEKFKEGKEFNSVFQKMTNGEFKGTTNGVIFIENQNGDEIILDFQGSFGYLRIEKDSDEIYDVSTKTYFGKTTSGKAELKYETYAWANGIGINLNNQWYELSAIDGACDMVINGIDYTYKSESVFEYLVLTIDKELILSNWQYLIRTEHDLKSNNIEKLKTKENKIKLLPNSTIIFVIKRK